MLLLSVDQCSLLLLLSEMSEVLNHNGDSITLEIIVLLPAEAPSPSSLSAHPLSLRQILWTNEFPALIMNPYSCLTHYGSPTDIRNPLTFSNNPLFAGPSTCEAVMIKSLLEIKSDLDLDFFRDDRLVLGNIFFSEVLGRHIACPLANFLQDCSVC